MKPPVLLITQNCSFPADRRVTKEALTLRAAGYPVMVISPASALDPLPHEIWEGIDVYRYRNRESGGGICGFLAEYANALPRICVRAAALCRRRRFRVLHVANPPDFFWPLALLLRPFGVRFLFDQHDMSPEVYRVNHRRQGILYRMLLLNERLTCALAHGIITINESLMRRLEKHYGLAGKPVAVVYNGPRADFRAVPDEMLAVRYRNRRVVLFVGCMEPLDGVDTLIDIAERVVMVLGRTDVQFVLVGEGTQRPRLQALAAARALSSNVEFVGRQDHTMVMKYAHVAEVCVAPDLKTEFTDHFTLVKVLEYMKAGRAVVAFRLEETRHIAGDTIVYAEGVSDFADHVVRLLDRPDEAGALGSAARQRIEASYLWEHQERELLRVYGEVLGGRGG
jgi:glycosyltransferase involved in cell wall biosynthesis